MEVALAPARGGRVGGRRGPGAAARVGGGGGATNRARRRRQSHKNLQKLKRKWFPNREPKLVPKIGTKSLNSLREKCGMVPSKLGSDFAKKNFGLRRNFDNKG